MSTLENILNTTVAYILGINYMEHYLWLSTKVMNNRIMSAVSNTFNITTLVSTWNIAVTYISGINYREHYIWLSTKALYNTIMYKHELFIAIHILILIPLVNKHGKKHHFVLYQLPLTRRLFLMLWGWTILCRAYYIEQI